MNDFSHTVGVQEPVIEHFQTPSEAVVIVHLSAVVKKELKIEGDNHSLTIKIVKPLDSQQVTRMGYYSHEVVKLYGFSKTVTFPFEVDSRNAKATFKHGVLEVRIPRV